MEALQMDTKDAVKRNVTYLKRGTGPRLVFISGAVRGREFSLKHVSPGGRALIGSHSDADLWFSGAAVHDKHAFIEFDGTKEWLISVCDPKAIVKVNREPVGTAHIVHGDLVEIGRHKLVFLTNNAANSRSTSAREFFSGSLGRLFRK